MLQQTRRELVQRIDEPLALDDIREAAYTKRRGLHLVQEIRYRAMVRFKLVDDRVETGVSPAHAREQRRVLCAMVTVDEPAVLQAIHS
ncbi:MAG TPA: hypothetical protein VNH82_04400 [Candidatus Dormibacteraeota bacterium]|nr:hypothetical protein [Candidatus Dormibacteraeota bacterium]